MMMTIIPLVVDPLYIPGGYHDDGDDDGDDDDDEHDNCDDLKKHMRKKHNHD